MDLGPGEAKGAPDHPHRGFETVTYVLEGSMEHKDSAGNSGKLNPGDVQWMTAGAGVVHSEMPSEELLRDGGRMHGFQLWVNLPSVDKMMRPRYQDVSAATIPQAQTLDGSVWVRVIAGEALGSKAVIDTRTPIMYLHYILQPGSEVLHPVPPDYNAFAYSVEGQGLVGDDGDLVQRGQIALFAGDSDVVRLSVPSEATEPWNLLLLAGVPIGEPVVRYGPFAMNTEAEIRQAIEDYRAGRMGVIDF
ncbi:MAG: hypothetical protein C1O27_000052 [Chloroflexi bacterium]|jgi:hypothetical protein|nr:MAG: hypothetical protein C1O27_000052 [Chloroflexota bacterium]